MLIQSITSEISEMSWTITTAEDDAETAKRLNTHPDKRTPIQKDLPDDTAEDIHDLLMRPNPDIRIRTSSRWRWRTCWKSGAAIVKAFPAWAYEGEDDQLASTRRR